MKIGCFGGTFDPPHLGHMAIVELATEMLDKVIIIPNHIPPCKNKMPIASPHQRIEMLKLIFNEKNIYIDDFEIHSSQTSYTFFTLQYLKEKFPSDNLVLILGQDQIQKIDLWYKKEWIINNMEILCFRRSGFKLDNNLKSHKIKYVDLDIDISSSRIRKNRDELKTLLAPSIYNYINEKRLYK